MRTMDLIKLGCDECGQKFNTEEEAKKHFHSANKINENPLTYLLLLPPGCKFGSLDAAKAIPNAFAEVQKKHSGIKFQLVPFGSVSISERSSDGSQTSNYQYLESALAVAIEEDVLATVSKT